MARLEQLVLYLKGEWKWKIRTKSQTNAFATPLESSVDDQRKRVGRQRDFADCSGSIE